jgi:hypothetical protein
VKSLDRGDHGGRPTRDQAEQGRESVHHERVDAGPVSVVKQRHGDRRERVHLTHRDAQSGGLVRDG